LVHLGGTYSKSRVCIWMEDRKGAHWTGKDTHGVSIMGHWLYDILNTLKTIRKFTFECMPNLKLWYLDFYMHLACSGTNNSSCCILEISRKASHLSFKYSILFRELLVHAGLFVSCFTLNTMNSMFWLCQVWLFSSIQLNKQFNSVTVRWFMFSKENQFGRGNKSYKPNPRLTRALDILFILHAEHEMNCSTAAVRHLASR